VLIGDGQTYRQVREEARGLNAENITFIPRISYPELREAMKKFDISLGIFGSTDKTTRVIPNKVYDGAALGLPIITADTKAIREIFTDGEDIILSNRNDPEDLALKIHMLGENPVLRKRIGQGARRTYEKCATPEIIGRQLLGDLEHRLVKR
jgi:glycosyltransferase involved in cell wall biosynthesis